VEDEIEDELTVAIGTAEAVETNPDALFSDTYAKLPPRSAQGREWLMENREEIEAVSEEL
jgi:hypothetical protein